jgi:hypothetical protein
MFLNWSGIRRTTVCGPSLLPDSFNFAGLFVCLFLFPTTFGCFLLFYLSKKRALNKSVPKYQLCLSGMSYDKMLID